MLTADYDVVIPVCNGGSMLLEALASIQEQSLPPRQIIVVDDGSTDGTAVRAQAAAPTATVITQQNRGIGGALDAGVAVCTSSFVAFLDHDDLWLPGKAEAQMSRMLGEERSDVVSGGVVNRWVRGCHVFREELMGSARVLGASLFKTEFVRSVGSFSLDAGHHEVIAWWSLAARFAPRVVRDEDVVLVRRIHGANSTMGLTKETADSDLFRRLREHIHAKRDERT
jgi:glycosyltransferase involved in cell wall biosynthesis